MIGKNIGNERWSGKSGDRRSEDKKDKEKMAVFSLEDVLDFDYLRVNTHGFEQAGEVVRDDSGNIQLVDPEGKKEDLVFLEGDTEVLLHVKSPKFVRDFRFLKRGDAVALRDHFDKNILWGVVLYDSDKDEVTLHNDVWGYYHDGGRHVRSANVKDLYELVEHIPASQVKDYRDLGISYAEYKKLGNKKRTNQSHE